MSTLSGWSGLSRFPRSTFLSGAAGLLAAGLVTACRPPDGVTLVPIDGGRDYFHQFSPALPDDIFPVGAWAPEGGDSAASLATHDGLTNVFVEDGYMADWRQHDPQHRYHGIGGRDYDAGFMITDEVDQWAGAGDGRWSGQVGFGHDNMCSSGKQDCGYTVLHALSAGWDHRKFRYVNFSKIMACQADDATFSRWASYVDVLSVDIYFFIEDILGTGWWGVTSLITGNPNEGDLPESAIRQASNYGRLINRLRRGVGYRKPVWSFHELVGPTPAQFRAGIWSAVINGARGIIYFTHNYRDKDGYANTFLDPRFAGITTAARLVHHQLQRLNPALRSDSMHGFVDVDAPIDTLAKWNGGIPILLAHMRDQHAATATFRLKAWTGTKVDVLGEERTLTVRSGRFTDRFADGNAVHLYRLWPES